MPKKVPTLEDDQVQSSLGKDPSTKPLSAEKEDADLGWLGIVKEVLRNPFTSPLEDALYRSRWHGGTSRRQCTAQFRNNNRLIYKAFVAADIGANFFYMVIAMSFLTRGVNLHPIDMTISGLSAFIDFGLKYIPKQ